MRYFKKLEGERLYLSPMHPDDAEIYTKWLNDIEVARWIGQFQRCVTLENERTWLKNAAEGQGHYYAIVLKDGDRLIGNIGLEDVEPVHRSARLGIFVGEAEDRSKGYGTEAIRLLVNYAFRWLGLRNVDLTVRSSNARAIRCYEKAGFREYGRRHQSVLDDGAFVDTVYMEVLADQWTADNK
jgi:RimJ/RimL family protein N-acetyltransferase